MVASLNELYFYNKGYKKGIEEGHKQERKRVMEIVDSADDIAQAMYLLGKYIIEQELKGEIKYEFETN